jgi:hypothetical protein
MNTHKLIFSEEDDELRSLTWRMDRHGYARTSFYLGKRKYKTVFAHHLVCERHFGKRPDWEKREVCDHINHNKLDNQRTNLRIISIPENGRNRKNDLFRGTTLHKCGKWQASVKYFQKVFHCGLHPTRELAAEAARAKRNELYSLERSNA